MERLNRILKLLNQENLDYEDSFPISLTEIFEKNPSISKEEFLREADRIKTDLFRRYRLTKRDFLLSVYREASTVRTISSGFEIARYFVQKYLLQGQSPEYEQARQEVINSFNTKRPHYKLMAALHRLLQRISKSHQVSLHGTKEYSGVDLVKSVDRAQIGFQIKSQNDDISEQSIRYQHSKAREWGLEGYILVFARKPTTKVDEAVQVAHHFFDNENKRKEMYCALVTPSQLAELFTIYRIAV
jgi:hypothetical protein